MAAMGDNFQVLEILLFAVIAGILVFRLRSVLGRRTGNERRRDFPFSRTATPANPAPPAGTDAAPPRALGGADVADPEFDGGAFLAGARSAFEIVVEAFAAGDRAKLQPLLSPDVFRSFGDSIAARERAKEKQETKIVAVKSSEIVRNRLEGGTALVTVKFVSDQILVTRDASGAVVEGDPEHAVEHTDLWTFSRATRSPDPNWTLIATETPPPA